MDRYTEFYKIIADLIDSAQGRGEDIISNVDQMRLDLNNSEINSEDVHRLRLEGQIDATYNLLDLMHNNYSTKLLNFVSNFQRYVEEN